MSKIMLNIQTESNMCIHIYIFIHTWKTYKAPEAREHGYTAKRCKKAVRRCRIVRFAMSVNWQIAPPCCCTKVGMEASQNVGMLVQRRCRWAFAGICVFEQTCHVTAMKHSAMQCYAVLRNAMHCGIRQRNLTICTAHLSFAWTCTPSPCI